MFSGNHHLEELAATRVPETPAACALRRRLARRLAPTVYLALEGYVRTNAPKLFDTGFGPAAWSSPITRSRVSARQAWCTAHVRREVSGPHCSGTTATRELHKTNVPETRSSRELADLNFPETRPLRVSFFGNAFRNTKWPLRHIAEVPPES